MMPYSVKGKDIFFGLVDNADVVINIGFPERSPFYLVEIGIKFASVSKIKQEVQFLGRIL